MLPFGTHTALGGAPWTLATVLRYPPERFVSWFTYHCMRAGRIPDQNMFLHYLNNEANRNRAVKTLAAAPLDRPADTAPLALALERLAQFDAVVDFKRVQTLIDHIIDALDLPPVIQARLNVTTPRFAFDATLFAPEIEEVNALDAALYERAQGQLRLPQATRSKAPPPLHRDHVLAERRGKRTIAGRRPPDRNQPGSGGQGQRPTGRQQGNPSLVRPSGGDLARSDALADRPNSAPGIPVTAPPCCPPRLTP